MAKGSGTRSGLLWEVERLLNECEELPQVLLMENVPQVHGKKNKADFDKWCSVLESKGYTNVWQDLNAKDFLIPQNRNRTFMVSFLGDYEYTFPEGAELQKVLADLLQDEDEVAEKYYLSDEAVQGLMRENSINLPQGFQKGVIFMQSKHTIVAGMLPKELKGYGNNDMIRRVYDPKGLAPTIRCYGGGNQEPKVIIYAHKSS